MTEREALDLATPIGIIIVAVWARVDAYRSARHKEVLERAVAEAAAAAKEAASTAKVVEIHTNGLTKALAVASEAKGAAEEKARAEAESAISKAGFEAGVKHEREKSQER